MPGTLAAMDLRQEESGAGSLGWGYYSCLMACRRWSCPRPLGVVWLCHVFTGLTVQPSWQHASMDRSDNQSRGWFPTIYVPPCPPTSVVNGKFLLPAYSVRYISFSLPRGLAEAGDKGCKPEPPKFPSSQLRPRHEHIQVDHLAVVLEGVMPVQQGVRQASLKSG